MTETRQEQAERLDALRRIAAARQTRKTRRAARLGDTE